MQDLSYLNAVLSQQEAMHSQELLEFTIKPKRMVGRKLSTVYIKLVVSSLCRSGILVVLPTVLFKMD